MKFCILESSELNELYLLKGRLLYDLTALVTH